MPRPAAKMETEIRAAQAGNRPRYRKVPYAVSVAYTLMMLA